MNRLKNKGQIFILPSFLGLSIFYLIPIAIMIYFSLTINGQFDGFQGIKNLLTSNIFMMAMKNTLIFSVIGIFGLMTLALILSLIISKMTLFKGLIQTVLLSPLVIPTASIIMIWNIFFNSSGLVNDVLINFNQSPIDFYNSSYSFLNVLLLFFWKNLGYITLILSAAIENVDTAQYEAASIDGAGGLQKAFHITLPNIKHALIFVFVITMVNSFKAFREIYLLMGQYPHESIYSLQHYMNNLFEVMDYQKLSIIALSVLVLIVTVVLIILRLEKED